MRSSLMLPTHSKGFGTWSTPSRPLKVSSREGLAKRSWSAKRDLRDFDGRKGQKRR